MMTKAKRVKMENMVYDFFNVFDPTGRNTEYYRNRLEGLSDMDFDKFFQTLFAQKHPFLTATMVDYENPIEMKNLEKTSKHINVPLFEKLVLPYASTDPDNPIITKHECLVGWLNLKRMQQINFKKLGLSTDTAERNMLTGQVTGHDKNSRNSDAETDALLTIGATSTLKEFMSARADDMVMKREMNQQIMKNGYVSLSELTDDPVNKTALNTTSVFLIGAGLMNDLVMKDYVLPKTVKE